MLDQLLWQRKHSSSSDATTANGSSFRGWLRQLLVKFSLGRLDVQLQDCRCQFVVPWQLGPQSQLPEQAAKQQHDGIALSVRLLTVSPGNAAPDFAAASPGNVQGASLHEALGEDAWPRGWSVCLGGCLRCGLFTVLVS